MRIAMCGLLASILLVGAPCAQTYIAGDITSDTTWSEGCCPYVIQSDVEVTDDSTLTIEAGVTVAFDGDFILSTGWGSAIVATGAPGNRVLFTSNAVTPQAADWNWLLANGPVPSSFAYCTVEYAEQGIRSTNAAPAVSHCVARHCLTGMYCANASPIIEHCDITGCGTAIWIHGNASNPVINNNNIHGNTGWLVYVTGFPAPAVTIDAENNWWGTTVGAEIADDIKDSADDAEIYATIDFDPWQGELPAEAMSWGGVKTLYER
ncbi:right-handed parallel beta-helix repeat-containing protein [bacterium]|nr:right-handed parallel beta-helix repeat-containing protein [bacterium]